MAIPGLPGCRRMWNWLRSFVERRGTLGTLGRQGEAVAARHLRRQGWRILARGHRNRLGEIDLIALEGETVVFVEVKTRQDTRHGEPTDAVNPEKQRRLTRAALGYLKQRGWLSRRSRFDVVAIVWSESTRQPEITHLRNAFEAVGDGQMYA